MPVGSAPVVVKTMGQVGAVPLKLFAVQVTTAGDAIVTVIVAEDDASGQLVYMYSPTTPAAALSFVVVPTSPLPLVENEMLVLTCRLPVASNRMSSALLVPKTSGVLLVVP